MSNQVSHDITVALGLRLSWYAGAGITYNAANPSEHNGKAVTISADRTVKISAADEVPVGSIVLVESADAMGVKVTVEHGPVVRFKLEGSGTPAAADFGKGVVAGANGTVKVAATGGFGKLSSFDARTRMVTVLAY